jgi:hypothetical protein
MKDELGLDSWQGQKFYYCPKSQTGRRLTQPHIQRYEGLQSSQAVHLISIYIVPRSKERERVDLYVGSSISPHGAHRNNFTNHIMEQYFFSEAVSRSAGQLG